MPLEPGTFVVYLALVTFIWYILDKANPARLYNGNKKGSRLGLVQVGGSPVAEIGGTDIIFIHGLGSNPETSWTAFKEKQQIGSQVPSSSYASTTDVCWVTDFLPEDLKRNNRHKDRIYFYNYDSYWRRNAPRVQLKDLAHQMLNLIQSKIRQTTQDKQRRIVFVCYCYGGLIVKKALVQAAEEPRFRNIMISTKGLIFLGTPHDGTNITYLGLVAAFIFKPFGAEMSTLHELHRRSKTLKALDKDFLYLYDSGDFCVLTVAETKPSVFGIEPLVLRTMVVERESAKIHHPSKTIDNAEFPVDHRSLNKFSSRDNEIYQFLLGKLVTILNPPSKKIRQLPFQKVDSYIERPQLSTELENMLLAPLSRDGDTQNIVVVHGLSGTGKTQLVVDFALRHGAAFNPILWIDAQSPDDIDACFKQCIRDLGIRDDRTAESSDNIHHPAAADLTLQYLAERDIEDQPWLMIIDNVSDENAEIVRKILPKANLGKMVIVSHHPQGDMLSSQHRRIKVDVLSEEQATRVLFGRLLHANSETPSQAVLKLIAQIVVQLGYFAFAVDRAGAYILQEELNGQPSDNNSTLERALEQYLADFKIHSEEVLGWPGVVSIYEKNIITVWNMALRTIDKKYPDFVSNFFVFITAFDRIGISEEFFQQASLGFYEIEDRYSANPERLPMWLRQIIRFIPESGTWDKFYYKRATKVLMNYGLIEVQTSPDSGISSISMHRLVQLHAARYQVQKFESAAEQEAYKRYQSKCLLYFFGAVALNLTKINIPYSEPAEHFFRHIMMASEQLPPLDVLPGVCNYEYLMPWSLINNLARREHRYYPALLSTISIVEAITPILGENDPTTILFMTQIADDYRALGKLNKSINLYTKILGICIREYGINDERTLHVLMSVGLALAQRGDLQKAHSFFLHVATGRQEIYGCLHEDTLTACGGVVWILHQIGDHDQADDLYKGVQRLKKFALGAGHQSTLTTMSLQADSLEQRGRFDEALELQLEILAARKQSLPADHMLIIRTITEIANVYQKKGQHEESRNLYRQMVKMCKQRKQRLYLTSIDQRLEWR